MKRMRSAYARRRGLDYDGPETMRVGAGEPDLSQFHSPASIDPVLAAESMRRLTAFIARGATYGSIEAVVMKGSDNVGRWYAFRYAEHPGDPIQDRCGGSLRPSIKHPTAAWRLRPD